MALKPLEKVYLADGVALPDEEQQVVASRSGSILSTSTILKSDFFSNLQKMSLPESEFYFIESCLHLSTEHHLVDALMARRISDAFR